MQRVKYKKMCGKARDEENHFKVSDLLQTVSKDKFDIRLFFRENQKKVKGMLKTDRVCYEDSGGIYEGEFLKGFRHGYGKMTFKDGAQYTGEWFCGYAHGNGTFAFDKGESYNGQFFNNKRHGIAINTH